MGSVTPKGLQELLGSDSKQREDINSYRPATVASLTELLGNSHAGRDPYSFQHRIKGKGGQGGPYNTGGDHVGRELFNKLKPDTLDTEGPDPFKDRDFIGDEFQGMLMFGKDGTPAFHSLWPKDSAPEARSAIRVNIASVLPEAIESLPPLVKKSLDHRAGREGQKIESMFAPVNDRITQSVNRYAQEFEKTFGIHLDVGTDQPDAQIHVMGFQHGRITSPHGFASFPQPMQEWENFYRISAAPGYVMMNLDKAEQLSDQQIDRMVAHEFGHALGLANPNDLALFRNVQALDALTLTTMANSDLVYNPIHEEAPTAPLFGPLDLGLRKWVANPPALNKGNATYDLDALHHKSVQANKSTVTFKHTHLLPTLPIFAHGTNNTLVGTAGDDYLDTNTGYISHIDHVRTGAKQKFTLLEGHIDHVRCVSGNNTVIASKTADQDIHTGTGTTDVRFVYPEMTGEKTIDAEGEVILTLTASVLKSLPDLRASADQGDIILSANQCQGKIRLQGQAEGKGIAQLRVVSERGHTLFEQDTHGLSADALQRDVIQKAVKVAFDHIPSAPDVPLDRPTTNAERIERLRNIANNTPGAQR